MSVLKSELSGLSLAMVSRLGTPRSLLDFGLPLKEIDVVQQLCVLRKKSSIGHLNADHYSLKRTFKC